jgi:hypothetical protein
LAKSISGFNQNFEKECFVLMLNSILCKLQVEQEIEKEVNN